MKFIGVIAVLSFLVAGSVSAHAAGLELDCPEDNTYTPSPPQMLNKNVTPYTYVPIPEPVAPSGLEKTCPNYATDVPSYHKKFIAKINDPKVFTPIPEAGVEAWCSYMMGYLGQGPAHAPDENCGMYSVHAFLKGEPSNLFGIAGTSSEVMQMVRLAWAQDIVEVGYARMDYAAIDKAKTGSVTSLTGDDPAFENSIRDMFVAGWDDVMARKAKAGYDWSGSVASFAPRMIDNFTTYYCKSKAAVPAVPVSAPSKVVCGKISAPKGQAYYQKQLQTMQYPASNWTPSPVNWSQAELEAQGWMATASGLGVLYQTPGGNYLPLPGTADLFNKWGFIYGSCKLNNAPECAALHAYQQTAGGFSHITDPVLKADMAITAYLEYLDWAKAQPDPAQNYTCVNWQCTTTVNGNTVTIPIAQLPKIMPALDWIKQNVASFEASYCSNTTAAAP